MPAFGGRAPFPVRCGGGNIGVRAIHQSLNQQRGTGYDVSEDSPVSIINLSTARAIDAAWKTNERIANIANPLTMPEELIPRWEHIYKLPFDGSLSIVQRRQRMLKIAVLRGILANKAYIQTRIEEELGDVFVDIEYADISIAHISVDDAGYPFGSVSPYTPWSSTVAHVLVHTQQPSGYSDSDYYRAVGKVFGILDPVLPAYVTFDWYRRPVSTPIAVAGGASEAGFYLDDEHNLDNNVFDA